MPFLSLGDGTKIFYKEEGKEVPPLVLVHGWTMNSWLWQNQLTYFPKYYRVVAPDLKGHGASDKPQARYTVHEYAEELDQMVDKLMAKEKFVLCGHSMGGMIGLTYGTDPKLSKRLKGLILCDTSYSLKGNVGMKGLVDSMKKGLLGTRRQMQDFMSKTAFNLKYLKDHRDLIQKWIDETLKCPDYVAIRCVEAWVEEYDAADKLGQIGIPVLIITSDNDGQMDPKNSYYMKEHIKNAQLAVLKPGIGHHTPIEAPDQFNKVVKDFIDKL